MATSQQASDRIISSSPGDSHSIESLNMSALDAEKLSDSDNLKEQTLSSKDESIVLSNPSRNATTIGPPRDVAGQLGYQGSTADHSAVYPSNVYAPQAQTFYYGGYENTGEWVHAADNLELGSPGIYNDNSSLMFHTGYGYNPQMPYGPYSPVTTPLPSVRGDGHIYSSQQFPFSGSPYYQQPVPSNVPYITSPTPVSQTELTIPVSIDQHGDGMPFGQRAVDYSSQFGSFGRGSAYPGHSGNASFYGQGFDGFSSGGHWPDWSKSPDGQRSLTSVSSGAVSPHPYGRNLGMTSQQQRPLFGVGSGSSSYNRGFTHNGVYRSSNFGSASISSLGTNDRWSSIDKARRRGRDNAALCGCNGALDILSEQNRGPRSSKSKTQTNMENVSSVDVDKNDKSTTEAHKEPYNRPNFVTEYTDARFFVIKSYSEDNVHKSIKYGVWASTSNGNRKLDAAYRETKEKQGTCPVFLLFSVNASAQFCGVAEMVGPVDFDKSVDYWQQDKWSGQFPVKWHIIKDVPNSQFRHIILENNDSKPVTNSRDTQEVKLEQGIEMLNIFKNYETDLSILDDFDFYEERQKAMQERKARQQVTSVPAQASEGSEHSDPISMASDFIKQMSKSFAQAVRLDESNKEESTEKVAISASSAVGNGAKTEDANPLAEQSS